MADMHLCADLVRLRLTGGEVIVANLEAIAEKGCTLLLEDWLPEEAVVGLECVECPRGPTTACFECRLRGIVTEQAEDPPLGVSATVQFTSGAWCPDRWKPRHLLSIEELTAGR
jgi:hypothetical protein